MKMLVSSIAAIVLAACSNQQSASVTKDDSAAISSARRVAFPMMSTLGDVRAAAAHSPASGLWTEIDVHFEVPCTEKLETFSYNFRSREDGRTDLLVSAIGSRPEHLEGPHCMSLMLGTKTITIPGIMAKEDINLVNLNGKPATMATTTQSLAPIGLELVGVHSLCPAGAQCIQDGTIVRFRTTKGVSCVDQVAPVTYVVEQAVVGGKLKLAASAVEMIDSRLVLCAAFPKELEITLPMIFTSQENIELTVVGGN